VRRQLRRESVVDLLPFEPREHPIGRGCRDELALREEREERSERARRRPVVFAVVVRDVEVGHPRLRQGDVDVRAPEDVPAGELGSLTQTPVPPAKPETRPSSWRTRSCVLASARPPGTAAVTSETTRAKAAARTTER